MNGHSAEEKIKILYEDSLREIRELSDQIQRVGESVERSVTLISKRETYLRAGTEKILLDSVNQINSAVAQVMSMQDGLFKAAELAATKSLKGPGGPLERMEGLLDGQKEALSWINRAAKFYEDAFVTRPMVLALLLGGICGGVMGAIVATITIRLF